jgi:hypothetical protein
MHAPLDALSSTFIKTTCKGQAWVGIKHKLCRKFMVTCEASGAREHGHDSKHETSSGRTNNARKGVDESIWVVQLVEHAGKEVMEEK